MVKLLCDYGSEETFIRSIIVKFQVKKSNQTCAIKCEKEDINRNNENWSTKKSFEEAKR